MANVQLFQPSNILDMKILNGSVTTQSPNEWHWEAVGGGRAVFKGAFTYIGDAVSGDATSMDYYENGVLHATWDNFQVPSWLLIQDLKGNDTTRLPGTIDGRSTPSTFFGSDGRDIIRGGGMASATGGGGDDHLLVYTAVYTGRYEEYTVDLGGFFRVVRDLVAGRDGTDTLTASQIQFTDYILTFDYYNGEAGAYRMYQAAFARTPDIEGYSYWVGKLRDGFTMRDLAYGFINSDEFSVAYGIDPTPTDFVNSLYQNVLGRAGEEVGVEFWVTSLQAGASKLDVLAAFANSEENVERVVNLMGSFGVLLDRDWL